MRPPCCTLIIYVGCTPCSALSQASCRSPDDENGMGLLPEEVGVHVVKTVFKKSPAEAAVALWADKRQEVAALRARFSLCRHLQDCRGELERFIFEVEKLRKGIKDLNNCWERGSKSKIQTITDEFVAAVIARYTLKSNGSSLTPSRCCFGRMLPWISAIYPD